MNESVIATRRWCWVTRVTLLFVALGTTVLACADVAPTTPHSSLEECTSHRYVAPSGATGELSIAVQVGSATDKIAWFCLELDKAGTVLAGTPASESTLPAPADRLSVVAGKHTLRLTAVLPAVDAHPVRVTSEYSFTIDRVFAGKSQPHGMPLLVTARIGKSATGLVVVDWKRSTDNLEVHLN